MDLFKKVLFLVVAQIIVITVCLYLHLDDFKIENNLNSINSIIEEDKNKTVEKISSGIVPNIKNDNEAISESITKEKTKNITPINEKVKNKPTITKTDIKPVEIESKKVNELNKKNIDVKLNVKSDEKIQKEINEIISKNRIIFKRLSTDATSKSLIIIEKIANILKENSHVKVEVAGFTDAKGDDKVNAYISKHRALSVRKILIKLGIDKSRLTARGYGESHPIVKNDPQGYSIENRRVEFKIVKE